MECDQALQGVKEYLTKPPLLATPKEGETLFLYLGVSENAVSSALQDALGSRVPIVQDGEACSCFGGDGSKTTTILPIAQSGGADTPPSQTRDVATRSLREYEIEYQPRTAQKAQVLADFVMELSNDQKEPETVEQPCLKWMLHVDGSSNVNNGGAGILIQGPKGVEIEVAARLSLPVPNNEAEYEALILGLELAHEASARDLEVFTDSQLIALQIEGTYETRERTMSSYKEIVQRLMGSQNHSPSTRSAVSNKVEVQVVSDTGSWKDEIVKYLEDDTLPVDPIAAKRVKFRATRFTLLAGQLYKRTVDGPLLKCLDEERALYVMREIHEGSCGNHSGARSLAQKIMRQGYFWPTLVKDSKDLVRKCESCQKYASLIHQPVTPMEPIRLACPFDQWAIDIVGPFPPTQAQKKFIIVAVEYFSKWVEAEAVAKISEKEVINFIWKNIICRSYQIREESQRIMQYNPEANRDERSFDLTVIEEKREVAYARILHHKGLMMKSHDRKIRPRQLQVGDLVLKKVEASKHVGKFEPPWEGLYKITKIKKKGTYRLQDMQG
ncbi:UNVERIFIED_CONTAM: hypothetical protein Sindi_0053600 [Sesamum indicum]